MLAGDIFEFEVTSPEISSDLGMQRERIPIPGDCR